MVVGGGTVVVGGWWWVAGLRGLGVQLTSAEKAEHLFLNLTKFLVFVNFVKDVMKALATPEVTPRTRQRQQHELMNQSPVSA